MTDQTPAFETTYDRGSYQLGGDQISISVCPPSGESLTLYISLACWQLGETMTNYTLLVISSQVNDTRWQYLPIASFTPFEAPFWIAESSKFIPPNGTDLLCGFE
jgi:hypothetical protein